MRMKGQLHFPIYQLTEHRNEEINKSIPGEWRLRSPDIVTGLISLILTLATGCDKKRKLSYIIPNYLVEHRLTVKRFGFAVH